MVHIKNPMFRSVDLTLGPLASLIRLNQRDVNGGPRGTRGVRRGEKTRLINAAGSKVAKTSVLASATAGAKSTPDTWSEARQRAQGPASCGAACSDGETPARTRARTEQAARLSPAPLIRCHNREYIPLRLANCRTAFK